jgi:hypothetical protein
MYIFFFLLVKAHWQLYLQLVLTFINSTFCPHTEFLCFLWFSEQVMIILAIILCCFIAETLCVYCAVITESLTIIQVNFRLFGPMARAVSLRPVTAEARLWSLVRSREIYGGQNDIGTGFSPVSNIQPGFHTHLHLHVALTRKTKGDAWEPSINQCYFENRWSLVRKEL